LEKLGASCICSFTDIVKKEVTQFDNDVRAERCSGGMKDEIEVLTEESMARKK
jgi:hypothetical protein